MKKTTKLLCLLLALLMLMSSLAACKKSDKTEEGQGSIATTAGTVEDGELKANVPDVDMDGKVFNIITDDWWGNILMVNDDFSATMITGDGVADAQYMAMRTVKERYNCDINQIAKSGPGESVTQIRADYQAGALTVDIYLSRIMYWQALAQEGLLHDLNDVPYLDFTKPWWDENSVKELSIGGSLFTVAGDFTLQDEYMTSCVVFNKKLFTDLHLQDPYQMVRDNNWTFETFLGLSSTYSENLDDPIWDENDHYGFLYQRDTLNALLMASGGSYAEKDINDIPYISIDNEKNIDILDAAMDLLYHQSSCQVMDLPSYINTRDQMFKNNQALFCYFYMASLEPLRQMETDFGILPVPKYSASQTEWNSEVSSWSAGVTSIPVLNSEENLEFTCIFLEALCCENRKQVMPAYYDRLLNGIVVRDEESIEMLDLIFENRLYDLGACLNFQALTEVIYLTMKDRGPSRDIVSYFRGRVPIAKKDMERMVDAFKEMKAG